MVYSGGWTSRGVCCGRPVSLGTVQSWRLRVVHVPYFEHQSFKRVVKRDTRTDRGVVGLEILERHTLTEAPAELRASFFLRNFPTYNRRNFLGAVRCLQLRNRHLACSVAIDPIVRAADQLQPSRVEVANQIVQKLIDADAGVLVRVEGREEIRDLLRRQRWLELQEPIRKLLLG